MLPVFDGHNDILYRIQHAPPGTAVALWREGQGAGQLDLPRMKAGGFAGGFFAVYVDSPGGFDGAAMLKAMDNPPYAFPLPELIGHVQAQPVVMEQVGHLLAMERATPEALKICRNAAEIRAAMARGQIAAVLHFEGAEAIDPDLDALHVFHAMGLRSLGPVWSRPTIFGHGVPFRFPSGPDTGPGLTEAGMRLVRECNALRIMIDLSHMNEAGFRDVARLSDAPLVATHSNANAVCASSRNLLDWQLHAIRDTGGMAGLNFATSFLRPDGRDSNEMTLEPMLRHLDHMIAQAGEDHVGLGSDFDGATMPRDIGDVTGLPRLLQAMQDHGYGEALMRKLTHENWLRLLTRTWGG